MPCEHHKKCGDCFSPAVVLRLEAERDRVSRLAIDLAHALRIAVDTVFPDERLTALQQWERYILDIAEDRWGVWIAQGSKGSPRAYWWQGPEYKGDHVVSRAEAEREASKMRLNCPQWTYEARPYTDVVFEKKKDT